MTAAAATTAAMAAVGATMTDARPGDARRQAS
jgi:hypothetical protein